jgi:hypothetical protein
MPDMYLCLGLIKQFNILQHYYDIEFLYLFGPTPYVQTTRPGACTHVQSSNKNILRAFHERGILLCRAYNHYKPAKVLG